MSEQATAGQAGTITVGDLVVNRLGYGAMRITGDGIWGQPNDHDVAIAALRRAVELGCNFIDTANSYGPHVSEELIAEAFYPYDADLVVATKGGLERSGPNRWEANGDPAHLKSECEGSLNRLKVDQIALYQLHRPDPNVPFAESVGALVELQKAGKIKHIGVSNVSRSQLGEAQSLATVVSVQNRFNSNDRSSAKVLTMCEEGGLAFLPWAPIQDTAHNPAVAAAAARLGATERQIALAWLLAISPAMLPIPGSGSADHIASNVAAAGMELTEDEVAAISAAGGA